MVWCLLFWVPCLLSQPMQGVAGDWAAKEMMRVLDSRLVVRIHSQSRDLLFAWAACVCWWCAVWSGVVW